MARTADYGLGEFTYPRGWFMVAEAAEVSAKPATVHYFGKDFVLYRGESGTAYMVDAYCPHMGAHLAKNATSYIVRDGEQVEGESIRCPFHGWRFGPDGACNHIPYSSFIPKAAQLKTYPIVERAGIIWYWHDPEEQEPDVDLPPFAEWDDPSWVRWNIDHLGVIDCHPQEIVDNMADAPHMVPVHGSTECTYFTNAFEGAILWQKFGAGHRTLVGSEVMLETDTWYTGPAILQSRLTGSYPSLMLICHTPVDDGVVMVWHALMSKAANMPPTQEDIAAAQAYAETGRLALAQDFEIWGNKRPCFNPLQIPADGPTHKVRIWYRQFYNPRARAGEFQRRVEGEVTTYDTRPEHAAA